MAKYKLEFRHRAQHDESIAARHAQFIEGVSALGNGWDFKGLGELPDIGSELLLSMTLDKVLPAGITGRLTYQYREEGYLENDAQYDDTLFIEFSSERVDLSDVVKRLFPSYVKAFGCYRATLHDWTVTRRDWPKILEACEATGKDVNGRDGIYRINAVNYFDGALCRLEFNLTPKQMVERLNGKVEAARAFEGGILLIYTSYEVVGSELESIDAEVRVSLGQSEGL
ncbi:MULTISPECIES: hypothetical protein [Pseudomonas syringae group]|uniref:Uncharacterized protein n=3 Tax=Pseudomonas syringae group TaxID=136849 RepID=A0ABY1U6K5_PSESX|nr:MULTISPECIES: hypothetical protein [Pseudomonas syringae group]KWT02807.1 hypothetical protein AL046_02520 [Pseudomonas syringae pv. avii]PHN69603.1 hypothetical protein AO286_01890 [Pseudomonas syringae]POP89973.1 hypothetical protein CXB40_29415 [Pseudomonas syringae pv. avii]RMR16325.1 hypothetical protein ALP89_200153 [Pseudomonas syringae pv. persicae]SOQ07660.1 hypothetical protein CFBP1573P_01582 [Pseudomonas syringae pv. persicae]